MSKHHEAGPECPLCEQKLATAHPTLVAWFRRVKARYENIHISWAFRGEADQNKAFMEGRGPAWPLSKHNNQKDSLPYSLALDLFTVDDDGVGRFPPMLYAKLAAENVANHEPIKWGGTFKKVKGDLDHFELS